MLRALCLVLTAVVDGGEPATPGVGRERPPLPTMLSGADAGVEDGGLAGAATVDAGAADGGSRARWRPWEGALFDGGVSDLVELPVGAQVELTFPQRTVAIICDDPTLFTLEALPTTHRFTGLKPGHTHCGFWYAARPFPHRYVDIAVVP